MGGVGLKKVLIVTHSMELGGAERALLGLLGNIDYKKCSVDLFLERHVGELLPFVPKEVNLMPENPAYACMAVPAVDVIKKGKLFVALGRLLGKRNASKYIEKNSISDGSYVILNYSQKYTVKYMPMISNEEYDLAVSFLTPHYFAMEKTRAKTKIAWIHTDYSAIETDRNSEIKMWEKYDKIISISPDVTKSFLKLFPELNDKITVIPNMHPVEFIKSQSNEFFAEREMRYDGIKLLSIGRFCTAKNFDNLPYICKELIEKYRLNVKWYIIGYGTDTDLINKNIADAGMQDNVIVLGKKENPYPYIKHCDFYVQPSRYEGNAVTVNEALILGKKVIITDYPTAASQIDNGVNGVIVPLENTMCAKGIYDFIKNNDMQKKIEQNVLNSDFSNSEKIIELYNFLR